MKCENILSFWFKELSPEKRFAKDDLIDRQIRERFYSVHQAAETGELYDWRDTADGALAEIIVLDQFSRNLFRDDPRAFACDTQALVLAQEAIRRGLDEELSAEEKAFLYMPFMHSESLVIHEQWAMKYFRQKGLEVNLDFEIKHKVIIERFGRYPHRNKVLGRISTEEEEEFLKEPGSSF